MLNGLQGLTLLRDIEVRVYDFEDEDNHQEFVCHSDLECDDKGCYLCPRDLPPLPDAGATLKWRLSDAHNQYGILLATLPAGRHLSHDQQQLVDTLVEQLTSTLALDRHQEHQQQLIVMEERATIARELHDSIAQSLSCLKMQIACLQMQGETLSSASQALVQQMREELNGAYRQLRELLTTFRLQLTEPGLLAALQSTVAEFNPKLGLTISLDYQLGPRTVPAYQAIHLLQIAREALSNILKHAAASEVSIQVINKRGEVTLSVCDNGRGLPAETSRPDHYGLIIMRDRAKSLHGRCDILPRSGGGTEVRVSFTPDNHAID